METDWYSVGVAVSFLIWVYQMGMIVVNANSQYAKNLRRVGMRLSWLNGRPAPRDASASTVGAAFKFLLLSAMSLVSILLSWAFVLWFVGSVVYQFEKQIGAPEIVRNFYWKMRNIELSQAQIETEMAAMKAALDTPVQ